MRFLYFWDNYRIFEDGTVLSRTSGEWKPLKKKKSKTDKHGGFYLTVSLPGGHKRLHILVWECFKGPRRKDYVINHKNGDRENCALDNLEEITQKENIQNVIQRGNLNYLEYLMKKESFHSWLKKRHEQDNAIGDLARDVMQDPNFPKRTKNGEKVVDYIKSCGGCILAIRTVEDAWNKYESEVGLK